MPAVLVGLFVAALFSEPALAARVMLLVASAAVLSAYFLAPPILARCEARPERTGSTRS